MIPLHLIIKSQKDTRATQVKHKLGQVLIRNQQEDAVHFRFYHT